MNPTTTNRPRITPEGMAAAGRIAEVRQNVNNGATPAGARATVRALENPTSRNQNRANSLNQTNPNYIAFGSQTGSPRQSTGFTVPMPDTVPAEALNGNVGRADVRSMRDTMEQNNLATEQFNTDYSNLMGRVKAPLGATPFQDPQAFIEQTLLRRSTDTQNNLDQARAGQADSLRKMSGDLTETRNDAVTQFGLPDLQANLADTRNRIAERTNQLRTTLRDFETNAERRGVAREFVESEKGKVQADAAAELADLAIIESAQAGNVAMAQEDIDRAVEAKVQSFQFENAAIEAEITRLEGMDTRESAARSEQLQIALQERTRNIEQAIADEKQKLTYLSEAAANGADQGTLDAIRKATNVGEAAMMAGPFIGRLDRQAKLANIAQSYASIAASNTNRLLALAEAGDPDAISELNFDPRTVEVEIDPTTKRQLSDAVSAQESLLNLASQYKEIVDTKGFTNTAFGNPEILGKVRSLRALMTAEYKKAAALGTLDTGVLTLMDQIIGSEPTSTWNPTTNIFGKKGRALSTQLDTFITQTESNKAKDMLRLGINPTQVDFSILGDDDNEEINAAFGVANSSTLNFEPSNYFK